jgi:hypothetical protein
MTIWIFLVGLCFAELAGEVTWMLWNKGMRTRKFVGPETWNGGQAGSAVSGVSGPETNLQQLPGSGDGFLSKREKGQ